ncbi:hypothetical protein EYV94_17940 [Puteibacter caeruleilacunae]|nr:hypothetical protein EYV94_17940 [Puteibacter caeruleilacunae]
MITKMKKLLLFMSDSAADIDADLTLLGQLGVMHVKPFQPAKDASIERVDARIKQLEKAIAILERYDQQTGADSSLEVDYATIERGEIEMMEKVLDAENTRIKLEQKLEEAKSADQWYKGWGSVSSTDIEVLREKGVFVRLYLIADRDLKNISDRKDIQLMGKLDDANQVLLLSEDADEMLAFEEVNLPRFASDELADLLIQTQQSLDENNQLLVQLHGQKSLLEEALVERNRRYDVRNVLYGGYAIESQVRCWKGFIPEDTVAKVIEVADEKSWGYVIEDPSPEEVDEVPTLVRSSGWVERIRPVMNFMGLVPGYKELDVSKTFMIFFTFFTGILVGDAGYGLLFMLITFLVHRKKKFVKRVDFQLMYTLSASIMFWGILTGTYFGAESLANLPVLRELKVEQLASFGGDNIFVQQIMFLIGAVHLTLGHLQRAWRYSNSVKAIAQLGWVAIVWGLYLIVNQMVLGIEAPGFMVWLFIGGSALIAFFSKPGASFFKGVLSSIGSLPLSIINGFSDIISYIRLYAVGLSTVLMAASFNEMAIGDGVSTLASGIVAAIVLLLGHALNMGLAAMAVLVHGVRLNMLEYAGHAGVEFSGSEYEPFKLKGKEGDSETEPEKEIKKDKK